MMLHTKYHGSRPCVFGQDEVLCFLQISLCKTCDRQADPILAQGHNLRNLLGISI